MCQFFSCIATRDGRLLFTEEDSHETIIERARLNDTDAHLRHWVRVEVTPYRDGWGPVRVDETSTPAWWDEDRDAITDRVLKLADRVTPARAAYNAAESAFATYDTALKSAFATYEAVLTRIPGYVPRQETHTLFDPCIIVRTCIRLLT